MGTFLGSQTARRFPLNAVPRTDSGKRPERTNLHGLPIPAFSRTYPGVNARPAPSIRVTSGRVADKTPRDSVSGGRHVRFSIGDPRELLKPSVPAEVQRLAWALHCARNNESPRVAGLEVALMDACQRHGVLPPLVTVDVCPACGQDLPRSEVEP